MEKIELLLPAGNEKTLRAAVNNGADAVYLGLDRFNARAGAKNFSLDTLPSIVRYCHSANVKVYVTFNILIKNSEIVGFFEDMSKAYQAGIDAVIIQDPCFVPIIKKNFPNLMIQLSTQAAVMNISSIPEGVDRVVPAREMSLDELKEMAKVIPIEVFVHGALCYSYSGQCLFSSVVGGRSGNRGQCAQPCRRIYNNKYTISTKDLCLVEKLPELIHAGITALKVEGRMRSPEYVATTAKIYRKYIDLCYENKPYKVSEEDYKELMLVFNRGFTEGFMFSEFKIDGFSPSNRGIYLGKIKDNKIRLRAQLKKGDGIATWTKEGIKGNKIMEILIDKKKVLEAKEGDIIDFPGEDYNAVYKTSSPDVLVDMGPEIGRIEPDYKDIKLDIPEPKENLKKVVPRLFVKAYDLKSVKEALSKGADVIYYGISNKDFKEAKAIAKEKLFAYTPRVASENEILTMVERINQLKPVGVLVGNRGFITHLDKYELHLDYNLNIFNDLDMGCVKYIPIISPELSLHELNEFRNKNFIVLVHGDIVLMNSKNKLSASELVDEKKRHFKVRKGQEILNYVQLGLFNNILKLREAGIFNYYIDAEKDVGKVVWIYKKILEENFDDSKIKKGYTTGHFFRGVI